MDKIVDILLSFNEPTLYFLVFMVLLACGLGLPVPEDMTLFAGGLSAYFGLTSLWATILISLAGVIVGDSLIFYLGAKYGRKLTKKWLFHALLPDERLNAVRKKFHQRGNRLIFFARFMPGLRAPIYFSAGTLHLPYRIFLVYDGVAALISVPAIIGAVYFFGDEFDKVLHVIKKVEHGIVLVIAAFVLAIGAKWYATHRRLKRS